jgi:hypothetical protein
MSQIAVGQSKQVQIRRLFLCFYVWLFDLEIVGAGVKIHREQMTKNQEVWNVWKVLDI